jgi:tungstate transport system substrate-binding protein
MVIMVEDDPHMHRPYIVMEANPAQFPDANPKGARELSDFLLSGQVQEFLSTYRIEDFGGIPLFYPLRRAAFGMSGSVGEYISDK